MMLHHYDRTTHLYSHSVPAPEDQLATTKAGTFVPQKLAFSSDKALPIDVPIDRLIQFDVNIDGWVVVECHIGKTVYSIADKAEKLIDKVGSVPAGFTLDKPGVYDEWQVDQWVRNDAAYFSDLLQKKTAELNASCANTITTGFTSSALGSEHRYSSALDDQLNISGNVLAATLGDTTYHACYDVNGLRDFREHTPGQMILVGRDLSAHKLTCLQQATALKSQAQSAAQAQDEAALAMVVWPAA